MIKIVPDCNTIISGFLFHGNEAKLFELAEEHKISVFISEEMLAEVRGVISRSKFGLTMQEREDVIGKLLKISNIVKPTKKIGAVKDDPTDNKFIECAAEAKADYIVSGDKHLLNLKSHGSTQIIRTIQILKIIG